MGSASLIYLPLVVIDLRLRFLPSSNTYIIINFTHSTYLCSSTISKTEQIFVKKTNVNQAVRDRLY